MTRSVALDAQMGCSSWGRSQRARHRAAYSRLRAIHTPLTMNATIQELILALGRWTSLLYTPPRSYQVDQERLKE